MEYELFVYHHNQNIKREVEASRMPKGIEKRIHNGDKGIRSLIASLIDQLTGQEVKREKDYPEAAGNEQSLLSS
jgi:hypothetical protein